MVKVVAFRSWGSDFAWVFFFCCIKMGAFNGMESVEAKFENLYGLGFIFSLLVPANHWELLHCLTATKKKEKKRGIFFLDLGSCADKRKIGMPRYSISRLSATALTINKLINIYYLWSHESLSR